MLTIKNKEVNEKELEAVAGGTADYQYLFDKSSGLITAPELPNNQPPIIAPELPAQNLHDGTYNGMFQESQGSDLRSAPCLPD